MKKLKEILKREKRMFHNKDEEIQYKLNRLVKAIKLSPEAKRYFMDNYNSKLSAYSGTSGIFDYITIIIQMNTNNPEALSANEKKFFLNLITGIVEQNNTKLKVVKQID
jgi:hypothetical protein